jgi:cathepsin X
MFYQLAVFFVLLAAAFAYSRNELVLQDEALVGEVVKSPLPHTYIKASDLPESWDIRDIDGENFATIDLNQHIPVYCGSCWAHASFSSLADRLNLQNKNGYRDVLPAIQTLINCGTAGSCNGGDSNAANKWVYKNSIPDVTCQAYEAANNVCTAENVCRNCDPGSTTCYAIDSYPEVHVTEYGSVAGEENIMAEIYARGPVSCYIDANCIEDYTGGVADYSECGLLTNHAIQINGWGTDEEGTPYWIGRNSWGTYWGERGWFRIARGKDTEGAYLPKKCYWAVPSYDY